MIALAFASAVVEAAVGADGEVAAGRAPVELDGPEENSVTFTLVPGAGVRLRSKTESLALSYTPRIFYRVPNALQVSRPLILHQASLSHAAALDRSAAWASSAQLSAGEVDYTASGLFDPGSSAVRTSIAELVRVEGETGLKVELSRRLRWTLDASGDYTTPIGASNTPAVLTPVPDPASEMPVPELTLSAGGGLPESAQLSTQSSLSYAVSRTDRLATSAEVTYQWFPDTGRFLLLSPDISWESQASRRTSFTISAGVAYVITLETPTSYDSSDAIGGTGGVRIDSVLYKSRNTSVSSALNASLDWFFDPIAGTSQPRAGVDLGTEISIGRDWLIGPNASFYAVLRGARARVGGNDELGPDGMPLPVREVVSADSTVLRAEVPISYAVSREVSLSFGGRASFRGRPLSQDGFRLDERLELWAFFGLTVRLATGHDYGSWLSL